MHEFLAMTEVRHRIAGAVMDVLDLKISVVEPMIGIMK